MDIHLWKNSTKVKGGIIMKKKIIIILLVILVMLLILLRFYNEIGWFIYEKICGLPTDFARLSDLPRNHQRTITVDDRWILPGSADVFAVYKTDAKWYAHPYPFGWYWYQGCGSGVFAGSYNGGYIWLSFLSCQWSNS